MSYFERTTLRDELGANIGASNPLPVKLFAGVTVTNSGFGASVANFPSTYPIVAGASFNVNINNFPATTTIIPGSSISVGINGGLSITNSGFGVSVTNFPVDYPIIAGQSLFVGILGILGVSINQLLSVGITNTIRTTQSATGIDNGINTLSPQYKYFDIGNSGANSLVSGLSGYRVQVLEYALTVGISTNLQFNDGVTNLTGNMPFGAPGGIASPFVPLGLFRTGVSYPLILSSSQGTSVAGHLVYINI